MIRKATVILLLLLMAVAAMVIGSPAVILASDVTLTWDANSESHLAGYKVYYKKQSSGPSYDGTEAEQGSSPITVSLQDLADIDNPTYTLTGFPTIDNDNYYCFVVTAYAISEEDGQILESDYSNEACTEHEGGIIPYPPLNAPTLIAVVEGVEVVIPDTLPANINSENPSITVAVNVAGDITKYNNVLIVVEIYDADNESEGILYVNGVEVKVLFGVKDDSLDKVVTEVSIQTDITLWNEGMNTITFEHVETLGYRVDSINLQFN